MLESCRKSYTGEISISSVLEENFKNQKSPPKYVNSFKLYTVWKKKKQQLRAFHYKKIPTKHLKKNTNFKEKIENYAAISPFIYSSPCSGGCNMWTVKIQYITEGLFET